MKAPTPEQLAEITDRIVADLHPVKVVLSGSVARGEMGPDSDVDLLIIMPDGTHRRHTMEEVHRLCIGWSFPVDVVVATASDIIKRSEFPGFIYTAALREGKVLYAA